MSSQNYLSKNENEIRPHPGRDTYSPTTSSRFVIQKHAASHLHYDFRLEINGVLKSWAIPKGFPFLRREKRLAIQVPDHSLTYIYFEGIIPAGKYGAGTVMVWDFGTFETSTAHLEKELASGKLGFFLRGRKLEGGWQLVRLRNPDQWLLLKREKDIDPLSRQEENTSALSGRSMWTISNADPP